MLQRRKASITLNLCKIELATHVFAQTRSKGKWQFYGLNGIKPLATPYCNAPCIDLKMRHRICKFLTLKLLLGAYEACLKQNFA